MMLLLADRGGQVQPALADVRVRQAINLAFDRQQIVDAVFSGYALATDESFNLNGEAFNEDVMGTYSFDPEAARDLLAEAGYADGFTLTMPSTVISTNFEPFITQALSDIGITTVWEPVPPANIASSVASGQYPAVVWIEGTNAAGREFANYFGPNAFLNPFKWQDPEADLAAGRSGPGGRRRGACRALPRSHGVHGRASAQRPDRLDERDLGDVHGRRGRARPERSKDDPDVRTGVVGVEPKVAWGRFRLHATLR